MSLGLNNMLALQGSGFGNVSLAGSLFGKTPATGIATGISGGIDTSAFGLLLNLGQSTDVTLQGTKSPAFHSVILNSQLNSQQTGDVFNQENIHAPQIVTLPVSHEDAPTSEEVIILETAPQAPAQDPTATLDLNTAKEAAFTSQVENAIVGKVVLNTKGEMEIVDENGVVIDASFIKELQKNPAIKEFLDAKLISGEKIAVSEVLGEALVAKTKDVASQVVVKNNVLVLDVATATDIQPVQQNISNEWKTSQKAENSIINPVAHDTKAAPAPVANTNQQVTQPAQNQTAAPSTPQDKFSMDMNFDGNSDFSQNFDGDAIDHVDADWNQAQVQKNNLTQSFGTHLSGKTTATAYVPVSEQVSMHLQKGLQGQVDKISLQLDPADLGKVTIDFDFSDDHQSKIMITADKQETLDMLRNDARNLQKVLSDAGMDAGKNSLEFSLGQNQNQYQDADKAKKFTDAKFDITGIEGLGTEIESIVIPSSGVISVGRVNIVV